MINVKKEKCKLCGYNLKVIADNLHDNRYGIKGKYSVGYCFFCEMGETFPKPLFKDIPSVYEESIGDSGNNRLKIIYRKCKRSLIVTKFSLKLDRAGMFFSLFPSSSKFPKLLDVGCGIGDWLTLFNDMGFDAQGIDLNQRVIDVAAGRGLKVECRRIEELADDGKRFNIVVLSQVLEHVLEPKEVLIKIRKILEPGGKLFVSVPNLNSRWRMIFKKYWINWYMPFHIFHFTKRSILNILIDCGFKVERVSCYTPPTWWISSVMVRLFDRYGQPNKKLNKWWYYLILPFISAVLIYYEKSRANQDSDCLCVVATSII